MDSSDKGVRTPGQIRQQLKQVLYRHLQREIRENFRDIPEACYHNHLTPIGGSPERIGICRYEGSVKDGTPRGKVCDSRVAGCLLMARACKFREPYRTKAEIKDAFRILLASGDRGKIAAMYPDVAALMWVIDGVDVSDEVLMATEAVDPPVEAPEVKE